MLSRKLCGWKSGRFWPTIRAEEKQKPGGEGPKRRRAWRNSGDFGHGILAPSSVRTLAITSQLLAEDILELIMERGNISEPPMVPYEATAAVAMNLLKDHGIVTVHFAGVPPGTSALLIKFVPPETLQKFGAQRNSL